MSTLYFKFLKLIVIFRNAFPFELALFIALVAELALAETQSLAM